jgi:radical SAM protein with 4Fe4S-binding SPASM domain
MSFVTRLLEAPDLIQFGARNALRKRWTSQWDYNRGDGISQPPVQIDLKLVDACNLRCKMCPQWGNAGYNFTRPTTSVSNAVPLDVYKRLFDQVAHFRPWFFLWGGEPMLYPDILPLIGAIKERGMKVSLVTNGTTMKDKIPALVGLGIDVILFSIDGARDTHDNIRGFAGAFDRTMAAVRELKVERKRQKKAKPFITFTSVITAENQGNFDEIYELGAGAGIDLMLSVCSWFQTAESGRRQTEILESRMGITPWSWKGYLLDVDKIDGTVVRDTMRRIKARKWPFHYKFFPMIDDEEIHAFFHDHSNTFGKTRCTAPWVSAEILPNGDVANCRDYPDVVAGNIKDTPFLELWNKGRLVEFRKLLIEHGGALPVCNRCHGLMGC